MCLSTPSMPAIPEVQKPQEVKQAQQSAVGATATSRNDMAQNGGMAASTLLTGPTGIENKQLALQRSTLLGQ